jgi:hypothetical protein
MTCRIHDSGAIELYFYGELPPSERVNVHAHLRQCAECRRVLDELAIIRSALASRPDVATPPAGDWSGFTARLDTEIRNETADGAEDVDGTSRGRLLTMPVARRFAPFLAAAAMLVLATIGALIVSTRREPSAGSVPVPVAGRVIAPVQPAAIPAASVDPALLSLSDQHFDRSKLVVLGLATRDATKPGEANWTFERDLATTLLDDTRLYRVAAEERGMDALAGVMRDLELVLLQTSMTEQTDPQSLEQLQRLIRRRDLITKMNVVYDGGS